MFIVLPKKKKKPKIKFLKGPTHNLKPTDLISWTITTVGWTQLKMDGILLSCETRAITQKLIVALKKLCIKKMQKEKTWSTDHSGREHGLPSR